MRAVHWITRHLLGFYAFLAFVWLFAPIFIIIAFSFNKPKGKFNTVWQSFTLENWAHPFARRDYTQALFTSLKVALVSCIIATIMGSLSN